MQNSRAAAFGESHDVDHADRRGLDRLDWVELIRLRRCGAREVEDSIGFDIQRMHDVMSNQLKPWMADQMANVVLRPGEEVVDANDFVTPFNQSIAKMTSKKPSATGYQYCRHDHSLCDINEKEEPNARISDVAPLPVTLEDETPRCDRLSQHRQVTNGKSCR